MYKSFVAGDFLKFHKLGEDYKVSGFLVFGTFKKYPYELVESLVKEIDPSASYRRIPDEFLEPILEITVKDKKYWFVIAYGGALLSEWTHIACLLGSKKNIVVGSCGGLSPEANTHDIIVPTFSYGNESTTRAYNLESDNKHYSDEKLRKHLVGLLEDKYKVWEEPTVTYQAMLAETLEDVERWSREGYYGVEMEAATVFAVSNHLKVPSVAMVRITDNLIKGETVLDVNFEQGKDMRKQVSSDMLKAALSVLIS
ncbi:MAG: hypothetical protein Q7S43_05475 [bacterium]|nr:hypothetical protein [bacterium]